MELNKENKLKIIKIEAVACVIKYFRAHSDWYFLFFIFIKGINTSILTSIITQVINQELVDNISIVDNIIIIKNII